ncbi:MAG: MEKHLA domain-containing protein [Pseudomonadota bacterium]
MNEPDHTNVYQAAHAELLIASYRRLTGKELVEPAQTCAESYQALYEAPFGVVSHNTADDPIFNYANRTAQCVFEMDWLTFLSLPSRQSAEPEHRAERAHLLERVATCGFIDDYRGVRISSTGVRFCIEDATVWKVVDEQGVYRGQAAVFYHWRELQSPVE